MPLSHIGLTVTHLPTSTSFFLAALQPLGYRYMGQWGNQVGLGVFDADFFLTQETRGMKAGAAHIAFSAPSRAAVKAFYTSALAAGGRPHGAPAFRNDGEECFNAAVLDFDGNSVEVVFDDEPAAENASMVSRHSRVLSWNRRVAEKLGSEKENKTVVSLSTVTSAAASAAQKMLVEPCASEVDAVGETTSNAEGSTAVKTLAPSLQRNLTDPILNALTSSDNKIEISSKTLVGTILGAAAGAAVAYAMCKSEEESAEAEVEFSRSIGSAENSRKDSDIKMPSTAPKQARLSNPRASSSSNSQVRGQTAQKAIEAPPPASRASGYQQPVYQTVVGSQLPPEVEYVSGGPRSRVSVARSNTYPESIRSKKDSTHISELRISETPRSDLDRDGTHRSQTSTRSVKSKANSSTSKRRSSSGERRDRNLSQSPTSRGLESIAEGKSRTNRGTSILGRSVIDENPWEVTEEVSSSDNDTVLPSDSVSQVGDSPRSRPSSARSKSSTSSKNKASARSTTSRKSSASKSKRRSSYGEEEIPVMRPDEIVEPVDEARSVNAMRPEMYAEDMRRNSRGYWDQGTVMSMPVRGIPPSMVHDSRRSVATFYTCR